MATLLKGTQLAGVVQDALRDTVEKLTAQFNSVPKVVAVSVGENQASQLYLRNQKMVAKKVGIVHETIQYEPDIDEAALCAAIAGLNVDPEVHGIILQMPLPEHISAGRVLEKLLPIKDVEGITADNLGLLLLGKNAPKPCTALAAMELIDACDVDLYGKEAVVVGASKIVGEPVALMLMQRMATTTVCTIGTSERGMLENHVRRAEVLVVAVGKADVIPGEWVKEGAIVIDVGINRVNGKTVGDVCFEEAEKRAAYISPVPGGVGPLTVSMLMRNVVHVFECQKRCKG